MRLALSTLCSIALFLDSAPSQAKPATGEVYQQTLEAERRAIEKTQELLEEKLSIRSAEMRSRVRAMYKLSRNSFPRLWVQPKEQRNVSRWLGAARRIAKRDLAEIRLLRQEIELANQAKGRLNRAETLLRPTEELSFARPLEELKVLASFGDYHGKKRRQSHRSRIQLRRRGVELACHPGEEVHSLAAGKVRYVGAISGLGQGVIVEHEGNIAILAHLKTPAIAVGETIAAGTAIGKCEAKRLYLELRVGTTSPLGQAVDPMPYLR